MPYWPPTSTLPAAELWTNVRDYGADSTGGSDSSVAIQNAINALPAGGGTIFFPAGTYKVTATLNFQNKSNLIVAGVGGGPAGVALGAAILQWAGAPSSIVMDIRGVQHCIFRDFGMDPNGIAGLTAFLMDGNPSFNACQFNGFYGLRVGAYTTGFSICFQLGNTAATLVAENTFVSVRMFLYTTYGVQINSSQSLNNAFIGCEFQGQNDAGTEVGLKVSRGSFSCFACAFIKNNIDIDIVQLDASGMVVGFEAEQSNKFLNVTACGVPLIIEGGYVLVNGAGAGADAITLGNLSSVGTVELRSILIDNGKNININASNSASIFAVHVTFPGGGSFSVQKPNFLFGPSGSGITAYRKIATTGFGMPPIVGLDNRSGVTAADGSPIVLYAVPAGANQLFDAAIEIDATSFTSGTATYTMTYTENGVAQTIVVTATVLNVVAGIRRLIQPDASTNITVQLTGAFVATVRLSSAVLQFA